jgi:hypothetical protein
MTPNNTPETTPPKDIDIKKKNPPPKMKTKTEITKCADTSQLA